MRIQGLLALLLAAAASGCNVSVSTTPPEPLPSPNPGTAAQQAEAFEAAKSIIKALDRGAFEEVWEQSSEILKRSSFKAVFAKLMSTTRGNLGQPAPRKGARVGFTSKIDASLPEGEYSIVWVDTDFNGKIVTEKVVMTRESGQWKLAGYFMQTTFKSS